MSILKYKDYEGTATIDLDSLNCRGKILFINDLITYVADSPANLIKAFEESVDDYIQTCIELDREPQKPLKGVFNVRVSPSLHKEATVRAVQDNTSLNDVVGRALDSYLNVKAPINIDFGLHLINEKIHSYENANYYKMSIDSVGATVKATSTALFSGNNYLVNLLAPTGRMQ